MIKPTPLRTSASGTRMKTASMLKSATTKTLIVIKTDAIPSEPPILTSDVRRPSETGFAGLNS